MLAKKIVYGSIISPYVRKVLITLNLKKIDYEIEELIPFADAHKPKILQLNPLGKVPIFQDSDFIISDSSIICAYLEKKYYEDALIYPVNAESYAHCLWYEEYADTNLIPTLSTVFFNKMIASRFNIQPDLKAVKTALENKLPTIFNYLEHEIGDKKYLVDNRLSLADISITSGFINFEFSGHTVNESLWPNLARYINDMSKEKYIAQAFSLAREKWSSFVSRKSE